MDSHTGKKVVGSLDMSRSFQCCNRIGCSTRHSSVGNTQSNIPDKPKYMRPPFRFKNSNSSATSSSRSYSSATNFGKYCQEPQIQASLKEVAVAESCNRQAGGKAYLKWELGVPGGAESEHSSNQDGPLLKHLSSTQQLSSPTATSTSRYGKQVSRRLGSVIQDTASSFLRRSSSQGCGNQVPKTLSLGVSSRPQKYSLSNLGCASISDALSPGSSGGLNSRGASVRRKLQDGEGSSRGILSQRARKVPQEAVKYPRNKTCQDIAVSVRTRRGASGLPSRTARLSEPKYRSIQMDEPLSLAQPSQVSLLAPEDVQESSPTSFSSESPSVFNDSPFIRRPGSSSLSSENRVFSSSEDGDDYRRFNMEGIAQVLLALERIEQDEELTNEQLLVLEASLFLGSLSFFDQHRDMRLDIENMSYEELLALEEEMGTVSTALSEETLSKCIKRSTYRLCFTFPRTSSQADDVKCSICQEEYVTGEEVGSLPCQHYYHVDCIHQWLRLKNWCPVCKAAITSFT